MNSFKDSDLEAAAKKGRKNEDTLKNLKICSALPQPQLLASPKIVENSSLIIQVLGLN